MHTGPIWDGEQEQTNDQILELAETCGGCDTVPSKEDKREKKKKKKRKRKRKEEKTDRQFPRQAQDTHTKTPENIYQDRLRTHTHTKGTTKTVATHLPQVCMLSNIMCYCTDDQTADFFTHLL
eukprot:COSAG06_NODE_30827_length_531_cov_3.585648_1_plen_122_part_01